MSIFSEKDADYRVALVYVRIGKLINLKGLEMHLFKTDSGEVRVVRESSEITREELVDNVSKAQQLLDNANACLVDYDAFVEVPVTAEEPVAAAEPTPEVVAPVEEVVAPVEAPVEAPAEAPVTPEPQPADAPVQIIMG